MSNNVWNFVKKSNKFDSNEFLRIRPQCNLTVRMIGNPVRVVKIFNSHGKCAVIDSEEKGKKLKAKYGP